MAYAGLPGDPMGIPSICFNVLLMDLKNALLISNVDISSISAKVRVVVVLLYGSVAFPNFISTPFLRSMVTARRLARRLCVAAWWSANLIARCMMWCGSSVYMFFMSAQYTRKLVFFPSVFDISFVCLRSVDVIFRTFHSVKDRSVECCSTNDSALPFMLYRFFNQ